MGPVGLSCWRSRPAAPRVDGRHEDVGGGGLRRWRSRGRAMRTSGARPGGSSPCAADPLLPAASTAYRCPRYPRGLLGADERRERYVGGVAGQLGQFADAVSDGVVEAQLEQAAGGRLDRDRGYSASLAGLLDPGGVLLPPRHAPPFTEGGVRRERPRRAASLNARARSGTAGSGFGDRRRGGVVGGGPRHEVGYELEQLCVLA